MGIGSDRSVGVFCLSLLGTLSSLLCFHVAPTVSVDFNFSTIPECVANSTVPHQPVPKLAKSFTIKVEGKSFGDGQKANLFFDSEGYYESDGQRGATYVLSGGARSGYLYDFVTGSAFSIQGKDAATCHKEDLWRTGCNGYAYFIAELAGYSNISSKCNITFGPPTYLGVANTSVRAIKVQQWHQCVHDYSTNLTFMHLYSFTADGVVAPANPPGFKGPVPIRFHSQLVNTTDDPSKPEVAKLSVYDFTYYVPYIEDPEKFLPAEGLYCTGWARENETMPDLPDQFSLTMLTVARNAQDVHSMKLNFDFDANVVSFLTDSMNGTHFPPNHIKNRTLIRVVHDYKSGLSFSQPVVSWLSPSSSVVGRAACNITAIDASAFDVASDNSGIVHLRHARDLFGLNRTQDWVYVGQRNFNNMPTYVWITQRNTTQMTINTESYWLHENWTTSNAPVLAGIIVYHSNLGNGSRIETYQSTVSDYNALPFHWRTFDVEECLKNDKQQLITFCVKVQNYTEVSQRMGAFETGLRDLLADLSGASPLQFTDIQVTKDETETNKGHVWITVLEWTNVIGDVKDPVKYQSVDQVVRGLARQFDDKDLDKTIKFAGKNQTVTLMKSSLQSGSDLLRPTTRVPSTIAPVAPTSAPTAAPLVEEGYTSGSMAGLAIAMIIIGGVAGLVAGFLLWKRNSGIAYQVYD